MRAQCVEIDDQPSLGSLSPLFAFVEDARVGNVAVFAEARATLARGELSNALALFQQLDGPMVEYYVRRVQAQQALVML
jgi:hypothetical protein